MLSFKWPLLTRFDLGLLDTRDRATGPMAHLHVRPSRGLGSLMNYGKVTLLITRSSCRTHSWRHNQEKVELGDLYSHPMRWEEIYGWPKSSVFSKSEYWKHTNQ